MVTGKRYHRAGATATNLAPPHIDGGNAAASK